MQRARPEQSRGRPCYLLGDDAPVGAVHCLDPAKIIHGAVQLAVFIKPVCSEQSLSAGGVAKVLVDDCSKRPCGSWVMNHESCRVRAHLMRSGRDGSRGHGTGDLLAANEKPKRHQKHALS